MPWFLTSATELAVSAPIPTPVEEVSQWEDLALTEHTRPNQRILDKPRFCGRIALIDWAVIP